MCSLCSIWMCQTYCACTAESTCRCAADPARPPCVRLTARLLYSLSDNILSGTVLSKIGSLRVNSHITWYSINHMAAQTPFFGLGLYPFLKSNSSPFLKWQYPNEHNKKTSGIYWEREIYVCVFTYVYSQPFYCLHLAFTWFYIINSVTPERAI